MSRWCARDLIDTCFAHIPFVRCVHELFYSRRLRDTIDSEMEAAVRNLVLQCWLSAKLYTNLYFM